ncbi:MAG: hypothetical protein ACI4EA_07070 [Candidatus Ornithomonoglobus sp.]
MNIVKRTVKILGMAAMVMLISAVSVFAATSSDIEKPMRLYNEGFEEPSIGTSTYSQVSAGTVPYWRSTAINTTKAIELLKQNTGTYIKDENGKGVTLTPRAGRQSAELNPEEAVTMYQYLYGAAGSVYEWGVSHRARNNEYTDDAGVKHKDTMAVFIGPKQPYDPKKDGTNTSTSKDQFTKTVDWLKDNGYLDTSGLSYGDCKAFEVFTTKFADNGGFAGFDDYNDAISLTQTADHTEKWHVWIVVSDEDNWWDYGVTAAEDCDLYGGGQGEYATKNIENTSYTDNNTFDIKYKMPDYNYLYTVPADSEGTIYAFCAYETASTDTTKKLTIGNFIDYARMSIKVPVRVTSTAGGVTAVTLPGIEGTVTDKQQFSSNTAAGNTIGLTITPNAATETDEEYTFVGAYVNNEWKNASDEVFTKNADGTYTFLQPAADGVNSIHIVFAKHPYIIHSPNGGTYKGTTEDRADEITATGTFPYSDAPTAENGARFAHWVIAGTNVKVGASHTVEVSDGTTAGVYTMKIKDESGNVVATIEDTDIVVLIAHYEHPQTVNIYTMVGGQWQQSVAGGAASVSYVNIAENKNETITISKTSETIYVEDNTSVSISASPNSGNDYHLERIVSDSTVTTENTFTYYSDGPRTISVYYMAGKRKPIVSYVDEFNTNESGRSYVLDTINGTTTYISDVGGIYGNTVSTAFTAFWSGDTQTYTYVQWVIDLPFDTDTLLKKNSIINDFKDVEVEDSAYKTDTSDVNEKFKGEIYRCASGNTEKQLIINFPTVITGASSIYSTIILDGIYSPNSTAELRAVTEVNANYEGSNVLKDTNGGFSINVDTDNYRTDSDNYYIIELN